MDALSNRLAALRDQIREALKIDAEWPERNHQLCINLVEARDRFKNDADFGQWLKNGGIEMNHQDRAAAITMGRDPERLLEVLKKTKRRSLQHIYAKEWGVTHVSKPPPPRVTPEQERAAHVIQRRVAAGEALDEKSVREEAGVSSTPYRRAKAVHDAAVLAEKEEAEIALAPSAQERLEAAIRAHKKKLDLDFEMRVMAEARKRNAEMSIPHYLEKLKKVEDMLSYPQFNIMTPAEFNKIRACLHPDKALPIHAEAFAEAFAIFNGYKLKIIREPAEDKKRAVGHGMPRTVEEMLARKTKGRRK